MNSPRTFRSATLDDVALRKLQSRRPLSAIFLPKKNSYDKAKNGEDNPEVEEDYVDGWMKVGIIFIVFDLPHKLSTLSPTSFCFHSLQIAFHYL